MGHVQPYMTLGTQMLVYTHFIRVYLMKNTTEGRTSYGPWSQTSERKKNSQSDFRVKNRPQTPVRKNMAANRQTWSILWGFSKDTANSQTNLQDFPKVQKSTAVPAPKSSEPVFVVCSGLRPGLQPVCAELWWLAADEHRTFLQTRLLRRSLQTQPIVLAGTFLPHRFSAG